VRVEAPDAVWGGVPDGGEDGTCRCDGELIPNTNESLWPRRGGGGLHYYNDEYNNIMLMRQIDARAPFIYAYDFFLT